MYRHKVGTFLTTLAVSFVQQQVVGRLGQERQGEDLEQRCETVKAKQPLPLLLRTK